MPKSVETGNFTLAKAVIRWMSFDSARDLHPATIIALPWAAPSFAAMKGILHEPSTMPTMKPESRDTLLTAIAKAGGWIDDIRLGRIASFAGIAERETVGERHIRPKTEQIYNRRCMGGVSCPSSEAKPGFFVIRVTNER